MKYIKQHKINLQIEKMNHPKKLLIKRLLKFKEIN